jgi:taurine---2-oxoglutarate transaminase
LGEGVHVIIADELRAAHTRYVLSPWSPGTLAEMPMIVRGDHVYLYDNDGTRYLDLSSVLIATNLGHGHRTVLDAIHAQIERLCFSPPGWFNDKRVELARALIDLGPWKSEGGRVFFTVSGAQADEDAVTFARAITGRHKVLTAYRSFHGAGPAAGALTGENRRWTVEPALMPGVVRFWGPYPYRSPFFTTDPAVECERALAHLAEVIAAENPASIAALLIEPVVGSNGVIVPPPGYLAGVRALCDAHGIVMIADEVMCGFGRTGAAFATERFGVVPDMITFAKGVTTGYVPLGGVMIRETLAAAFDKRPLPTGHTYSGHPLAVATGLATLDAYRDGDYFARGKTMERWMLAKLRTLADKHEIVGDVRGAGAFFALEFVSDRASRTPLVPWQGPTAGVMPTLFAGLRKRGVFAFGRYNVIHIAPALVIEEAEFDEAVEALDGAIGELAAAHHEAGKR